MSDKKLTQYEKRKLKEESLLKEVSEKRDTKRGKIELDKIALDVILGKNGRHELVIIKYNSESKLSEVVEIRPLKNRAVGVMFDQKKIALKTLTNIK